MKTGLHALALCLMVPWATAEGAPRDGGRAPAPTVDLDLRRPPPGDATTRPPPPGAVLSPPGDSTLTRYALLPTPDGGYSYQGPTFKAHIAVDGTVAFSNGVLTVARDPENRALAPSGDPITAQDPVTSPEPVTVGGGPSLHFDATHEYLRRFGKDPARDAKAAFLTGTFDLRMKMALESRRELRQAALADLPARLDELWADPRLTPSERRQLLRAMRDGIASGPGGAPARAVLRDFARRHLPAKEAATYR
jgi:hypothetical protein